MKKEFVLYFDFRYGIYSIELRIVYFMENIQYNKLRRLFDFDLRRVYLVIKMSRISFLFLSWKVSSKNVNIKELKY